MTSFATVFYVRKKTTIDFELNKENFMKKQYQKTLSFLLSCILLVPCTFFMISAETTHTESVESSIEKFESNLHNYVIQTSATCSNLESQQHSSVARNNNFSTSPLPIIIKDSSATSVSPYATFQITKDSAVFSSEKCNFSLTLPKRSTISHQSGQMTVLENNSGISTAYKSFIFGTYEYIVIDKPSADKSITRQLLIGNNSSLSMATNMQTGQADGSFLIKDSQNSIVGFIGGPIAFDADNVPVSIKTTFNGNSLSYSVDHDIQYTSYPVVIRMSYSAGTDFNQYFSPDPVGTNWHDRGDGHNNLALCLFPLDWRFTWLSAAEKEVRWVAVYNNFYLDRQWSNTASMKDQFICHINYAALDNEWNLEPSRPVGASAGNLCNPS